MALETYLAAQQVEGVRKRPIDDHGKLRMQYFNVPAGNVLAVGDDGSLFNLCELPPGAVRVLPCLSRVTMSAQGASRTLDIGHGAYAKRPPDNTDEAANYEAFLANLDVSGAVAGVAFSTVLKYDLYSLAGVPIYGRIQGGTVPIGTTLAGFIAYLYE